MEPSNNNPSDDFDAEEKTGASADAQPFFMADDGIPSEPLYTNANRNAERLSAIERQRLKAGAPSPGDLYCEERIRLPQYPPSTSRPSAVLVIAALLIAAGAVFIYTNREHALLNPLIASISAHSTREPTDEAPLGNDNETTIPTPNEPPVITPDETPQHELAAATEPASITEPAPTIEAAAEPMIESEVGAETGPQPAPELALPIEQISLQKQPELFKQLVLLYRGQIRDNPDNSDATAALLQLREQALTELNGVLDNDVAATKLLSANVAALFPELANSLRQQPAPERETTDTETDVNSSANAETTHENNETISPPPRPEITSLSMTSGVIVDSRFEARNDGSTLMISLGYRNFSNKPASQNEDTLLMIIRAPGNPWVLAEKSIIIAGDRGTKNFPVETVIKEKLADNFQVDFILNGRRLDSRIVARITN